MNELLQISTMRSKTLIRSLILFAGTFLLSNTATFGQLDSASVSMSFVSEMDPYNSNEMTDVLNIYTTVNDTSDLKEIVVVVCDYYTGTTLAIEKMSKQDYLTSGLYSGLVMQNKFYYLDTAGFYKITSRVIRMDDAVLEESICDNVN